MRTPNLLGAGGILALLVLSSCTTRLLPSTNEPTSTICHQGETIDVSRSAAEIHLRHGDRAGACR